MMNEKNRSNSPKFCRQELSGENDLLSSVWALKERISSTHRALSTIASPRDEGLQESRSWSQTPSSHQKPPPDAKIKRQSKSPTIKQSSLQYIPGVGVEMTDTANPRNRSADDVSSLRNGIQHKILVNDKENLLIERRQLLTKLDEAYTTLDQLQSIEMPALKDFADSLQEENSELKSKVEVLNQEICHMQEQCLSHQEEVATGNTKLNQCNEILKLTEQRMSEQQASIFMLRSERDLAYAQLNELREVLRQQELVTSDANDLQETLKEIKQEKATLIKSNRALQEKNTRIQSDVRSKDEELKRQHDELSLLTKTNYTLKKQMEEVKSALEDVQCSLNETRSLEQYNKNLNEQLEDLSEKVSRQDQIIFEYESQTTQIMEEASDLESALKQKSVKIQALNGEIKELENLRDSNLTRIHELEEDVRCLKEQNLQFGKEMEEKEKRLQTCQQEMAVMSHQFVRLESLASQIEKEDNSKLNDSGHKIHDLRVEVSRKKEEIGELQEALAKCKSDLRLAQLTLDAKEKIQKKTDQSANDAERVRLSNEISRHKERLVQQETRFNVLHDRLKEIESELNSSRKRLDVCQRNNAALKKQKTGHEKEIRQLKDQIAELEKSEESRQSEMQKQCSQTEKLQRKVDSLKKNLEERDAMTESLKLESQQCQQQLEAVQKHRDDLKSQLSSLQTDHGELQKKLTYTESQIEIKQKAAERIALELEDSRNDLSALQQELLHANNINQAKVCQLERSLNIVNEQSNLHLNQVKDLKQVNEEQIKAKDVNLNECQDELRTLQNALQETEAKLVTSEQSLQESKLAGAENAQKALLLEEQHVKLTEQLKDVEHTLQRLRESHDNVVAQLEEKLSDSLEKVEEFVNINRDAENKIIDLEKDKNCLVTEINSLESQLSQAKSDSASIRLPIVERELADAQQLLDERQNDIDDLEAKLQKIEIDLQHQMLINTQFEAEFKSAQNDLKNAMTQLQELQDILANTQEEKRLVESRLKDAERLLKRHQQELTNKNNEIEELDNQVRSQEKQLKTRTEQVSQLDMTISNYKSEVEGQLQHVRDQHTKCQKERDQKLEQISNLERNIEQLTAEKEQKQEEYLAAITLRHNIELELQNKTHHVSDLETRIDKLEEKSESLLYTLTTRSRELDAKNDLICKYEEQVTKLQNDLINSRHEKQNLNELYREKERELQEYLDVVCNLEERLADYEKSRSGQTDGLETAKKELQDLQTQHKQEIQRLELAQYEFLESKQDLEANYQSQLQELGQRELHLCSQLEHSHKQIESLRSELSTRLELLKNANEAVVIKEAEIARLQAKISSIQRCWEMPKSSGAYSIANGKPPGIPHDLLSSLSPIQRSPTGYDKEDAQSTVCRALFSPLKQPNSHQPASFIDSLDLATVNETKPTELSLQETTLLMSRMMDRNTANKDDLLYENESIVSADDTLAKEREELFARLDKLNCKGPSQLTGKKDERDKSDSADT